MHRLLRENVPVAEVARRLGRTRQTIYNWLKRGEQPRRRRRASKLAPYAPYLITRLETYDLAATVLHSELVAQGYTGGITILREAVARIKARYVRRVVDRFETVPGLQAQVDWASCGTIWHGGRRRRLSLLAVVLGHSRLIWATFVVSERRPVLVAGLERAFRAFGAVPRELVFDNLKQVIAEPRREDRPAIVQTAFVRFAEHWGFAVVACPPYWPRAKGKVERAIAYIKRSFLEGRSFTSLDDLNVQLATWLAEVANVRIHGTTRQRPIDRFAADREGMLPLAGTPAYPSVEVSRRLADHDGRISFRGVVYSVDPEVLGGRRGEVVQVHLGADERLRIFHQGRLVGEHPLRPKGSPPQDDPQHAASRRRLRQRPSWGPRLGKTPRFEQRSTPQVSAWLSLAPRVAVRELASYEAGHAG